MESSKEDRRVRRTKKMLLQALTQLLTEKKINKITVTELSELADINRATFYLYYKDVFDMMEQVENELFENFTMSLEQYTHEGFSYESSISFYTYAFEFVKEYANICKILLGPDGDYSFVEKFKKAIKSNDGIKNSGDVVQDSYIKSFVIAGFIGVIQQWIEDDMKTSPSDMARFIVDIV